MMFITDIRWNVSGNQPVLEYEVFLADGSREWVEVRAEFPMLKAQQSQPVQKSRKATKAKKTKKHPQDMSARNEALYADYRGGNHTMADLAAKYSISNSRVRQIIDKVKQQKPTYQQVPVQSGALQTVTQEEAEAANQRFMQSATS